MCTSYFESHGQSFYSFLKAVQFLLKTGLEILLQCVPVQTLCLLYVMLYTAKPGYNGQRLEISNPSYYLKSFLYRCTRKCPKIHHAPPNYAGDQPSGGGVFFITAKYQTTFVSNFFHLTNFGGDNPRVPESPRDPGVKG